MSSSPLPSPNPHILSPHRHGRDRSSSRPSSRNSLISQRANSPAFGASYDDPVAIRNQMSTLKHTIRHQTAQLQHLENMLLSSPRPMGPADLSSSPPTTSNLKMQKRSSFEVLASIAGPDSSLPLPRRDGGANNSLSFDEGSIREGVPMNFGNGLSNSSSSRRASSPTKGLSRIPVSSVSNARALADEGGQSFSSNSSTSKLLSLDIDAVSNSTSNSSSHLQPPSPNRRQSLTPGGTTKVLADLQTGVINARNALENTKSQLRISQRSVAQLTRQTEDLKESRERLRLENEGLNNVVARKERLLQEILERARKAEAEASTLKGQLKTETTTSKKTLRDMETALAESTALSQKSEREYITLRDSLKRMAETWKMDTESLRQEMKQREETWKKEVDGIGAKYAALLEEVKSASEGREDVKKMLEEDRRITKELEGTWIKEIDRLKDEMEKSLKDSDKTNKTAEHLSGELARLRRLIQAAGRASSPTPDSPS